VDRGNIVHASDANGMVTITQLQPISVVFTIPADNVPQVAQKLRSGQHLPVDAYNRDNTKKLASGTVMTLDNVIDATTGTSKLKAVFDNKDNALFPQQFVNMNVLVDTLKNQLVVPNVAIQNGQQGTFVYVVDAQSKVHLKTVQTGVTNATVTDIVSGISEGDRIVIDGTDRLVENIAVRVRRPGEMENTPASGGGGRGRGARGAGGGAGAGASGNAADKSGPGGRQGGPSGKGDSTKGGGGFKKGPGGGGGR
jgi:multidrug efflux system membrane fusion protein